MSYLLGHVYANIPKPILQLAFNPEEFMTTVDNRIITEVIQARVLPDTNLMMGIHKRIQLMNDWQLDVRLPDYAALVGATYDAAFYAVPGWAREGKNIATVQCITDTYNYSLPINSGVPGNLNNSGNTMTTLASAAISSRTDFGIPVMPMITVLQNNILRCYPQTWSDGLIVECTLDYDTEFTNANQNVVFHLRNLVLNAVKTYIYNELVIKIDLGEITAGMQIGVVKDIVMSYQNEAQEYQDLLFKVRGSHLMDPDQAAQMISMMI